MPRQPLDKEIVDLLQRYQGYRFKIDNADYSLKVVILAINYEAAEMKAKQLYKGDSIAFLDKSLRVHI